ncbi:dispase autolysis-inducing protein [Nonomuraea mesophila]|uniref:Dispase autolysis-inducing protein n=1 Tax=Nonomuraea mesophila TaxID=2530382 RepID=A0A4V2ZAC4_9ACTN|nr:dispase autolysis-inducing protein [Nonomuraea mesophila]TDE51498.1 dispase autolysis-inducing protein [Nonomuraea mesophila]
MKKALAIGLTAALAVMSAAAPASADGSGRWHQPSCETVTGDGTVTYTRDEGTTLTPTSKKLEPVVYTRGLVALERPDSLLSLSGNRLSRSSDAGCTWEPVGEVPGSNAELSAARGDRAYAWDRAGHLSLATPDGVTPLTSPAGRLAGLGADRRHGDRLRVADADGQLHESRDGGRTWRSIGVPAWDKDDLRSVYTAVFDPHNLNHVVLGASGSARVTFNGGRTWTTPKGLSATGAKVNVFSAAISPASPNVVYVMGLDLGELEAGAPSGGRHIYRSWDGGRRFIPVVDQGDGITIPNGPLLAAHPRDPGVLYFVWGTGWSSLGTDIYRYDSWRERVTTRHNAYDRVTAIAFNPADAGVMYLGLAEEV